MLAAAASAASKPASRATKKQAQKRREYLDFRFLSTKFCICYGCTISDINPRVEPIENQVFYVNGHMRCSKSKSFFNMHTNIQSENL